MLVPDQDHIKKEKEKRKERKRLIKTVSRKKKKKEKKGEAETKIKEEGKRKGKGGEGKGRKGKERPKWQFNPSHESCKISETQKSPTGMVLGYHACSSMPSPRTKKNSTQAAICLISMVVKSWHHPEVEKSWIALETLV
eukprot:658695-Pelagomonas_calceolata.AAC.1